MIDAEVYPTTARILAERQELRRRCAVSVLNEHQSGRPVDPHRLQWARGVVAAIQPLAGPLSDGVARPGDKEST